MMFLQNKFMVREYFKSDIKELLIIENSVHVAPWTEETFKLCFDAGYLGWVWEEGQKILGFIIISLTTDECHILNICVAREFQRQGLGQKLLNFVMDHAKKRGAGIIYLEVRRTNTRAIQLYEKNQFYLIGERKDYYPIPNGYEDALIFAKTLQKFDIKK